MFEKCEIGNMENLEYVKDSNRNKRGIIVGRGGGQNVKTRKGIQWKNKYYYFICSFIESFFLI